MATKLGPQGRVKVKLPDLTYPEVQMPPEEWWPASLLLPEEPIIIPRRLAAILGLEDAAIIQQIHNWSRKEKHLDTFEVPWVYFDPKAWLKVFPWIRWEQDIYGVLNRLQNLGLIEGEEREDGRIWIRVDYRGIQFVMSDLYRDEGGVDGDL